MNRTDKVLAAVVLVAISAALLVRLVLESGMIWWAAGLCFGWIVWIALLYAANRLAETFWRRPTQNWGYWRFAAAFAFNFAGAWTLALATGAGFAARDWAAAWVIFTGSMGSVVWVIGAVAGLALLGGIAHWAVSNQRSAETKNERV